MTIRLVAITLALAAMTLAGCDYLPFGYTPVREITAAPGQFEGREVKLKGKVGEILQLGSFKAYNLDDGTGKIAVLASGALPAANSDVALKGVVKSAVIVGGTALGLRVEETQRLR